MAFAVGIAGILLYPSFAYVSFYWDANLIVAGAPGVEDQISLAIAGIDGRRVSCATAAGRPGKVTPGDVRTLHGRIFSAKEVMGEARNEGTYAMLKRGLGVTSGVREMVSATGELVTYLQSYDAFEVLCQMPNDLFGRADEIEANRTPEEIAALEREGEPKLREHVAKLEEFRQMFTRARATHEVRKVWFHALAWGLILVEVVGLNSAVAINRAVRKRRADEGPPRA
jgi:hypothetical protein